MSLQQPEAISPSSVGETACRTKPSRRKAEPKRQRNTHRILMASLEVLEPAMPEEDSPSYKRSTEPFGLRNTELDFCHLKPNAQGIRE